MRPSSADAGGLVIAFSGRGHAPDGEPTPTPFLARRLSVALGHADLPIHWAKQVHGTAAATVRDSASGGGAANVGECDALATDRPGVALAIQTADCVPILLASPKAVGAAHAGWRGSAQNVAASGGRGHGRASAPRAGRHPPGSAPPSAPAATRSAARSPRSSPAISSAPAAAAATGWTCARSTSRSSRRPESRVRPSRSIPPARSAAARDIASYRRDGAKAGRMIALIALL